MSRGAFAARWVVALVAAAAAGREVRVLDDRGAAVGSLGRSARLAVVGPSTNVTLELRQDSSTFHDEYQEIDVVGGEWRPVRVGAPRCHYSGTALDATRGFGRVRASACGRRSGLVAVVAFDDGFAELTWDGGRQVLRDVADGSMPRPRSPGLAAAADVRRSATAACGPSDPSVKRVDIVAVNDARRSAKRGDDTTDQTSLIMSLVADIYAGDVVDGGGLAGDRSIFGCDVRPRLVGQVTWRDDDPDDLDYVQGDDCASECDETCDADEHSSSCLLSSFRSWVADDRSALEDAFGDFDGAALFTGADMNGQLAGLAYVDSVCSSYSAFLASTFDKDSALNTAVLVSHELAHTLGMGHDSDVEDDEYVMSAVWSGDGPLTAYQFSDFSRSEAADFFQAADTTCLDDDDDDDAGTCGDGIVDDDEECDPGIGIDEACCRDDCTLDDGCDCAPSSGGCCGDDGTIRASGTVCRDAVHDECDAVETCDGVSASCPTNLYASPGDRCTSALSGDSGRCFRGDCVAKDDNCIDFVTESGDAQLQLCDDFAECAVLWCTASGTDYCYSNGDLLLDGTSCGSGKQCMRSAFDETINVESAFATSTCIDSDDLKDYHYDTHTDPCRVDAPCVDETGATVDDAFCDGDRPAVSGDCTDAPTMTPPPSVTPLPTAAPSETPTPAPTVSPAPTSVPDDDNASSSPLRGLVALLRRANPLYLGAAGLAVLGIVTCCLCSAIPSLYSCCCGEPSSPSLPRTSKIYT